MASQSIKTPVSRAVFIVTKCTICTDHNHSCKRRTGL